MIDINELDYLVWAQPLIPSVSLIDNCGAISQFRLLINPGEVTMRRYDIDEAVGPCDVLNSSLPDSYEFWTHLRKVETGAHNN